MVDENVVRNAVAKMWSVICGHKEPDVQLRRAVAERMSFADPQRGCTSG